MPLTLLNLQTPPNQSAIRTDQAESRDANVNGLFSAAWSMLTNTLPTSSGEQVNEAIALQHISVYASVRVIAESIGSLTARLYQRQHRGRYEAISDPLYRILTVEPNIDMAAPVFWESMGGCMALTGNSYAEILRNAAGQPIGLYPLSPLQTEPIRLPDSSLAYKTNVGAANGQSRLIKSQDVLHFQLFSWDGLRGLSPIGQARQALGLAIASEKFGSRFFGNGSKPGGILTPKVKLDERDMVNFRKFWESANGGDNQGRVGVLPQEWSYTQIGLSPEDSQFLQTRQFSRTDVAALFRLPPSMIGDTTRLSNNNHEQQSLSFVTDTLRPYLVRIEAEIARKLLPKDGSLFLQFDVTDRLRGDFATTMQGFAVGKQWGFYSTNDVREKLGENPIGPEGDVYWCPVNMTNSEALLHETKPPEPSPSPDSSQDDEVRDLYTAYIPAFASVFADGVGRICQRSKRDVDGVSLILTPILQSIAHIAIAEARTRFELDDSWNPLDRITKDAVKSIATRAADWTDAEKQQISATELHKAIRSIHINTFREAGAALALATVAA